MGLETLWFGILVLMLTVYVVLDGFDLGVGALHLFLPKSDEERRLSMKSIGPVWDGNEVWLLAAGGTLYFAFPGLYASALSGLYLALIPVLWLLIFRGVGLALRNHLDRPGWRRTWDRAFGVSSLLLLLLFGVTLGNVLRGVPITTSGWFFSPLWTDFLPEGRGGLIDWYTLWIGAVVMAALLHHGALWLNLKLEGAVQERAVSFAKKIWWVLLGAVVFAAVATLHVQPQVREHIAAQWRILIAPAHALGFLIGCRICLSRGRALKAFLLSSLFLSAMMVTAALSLYPTLLPSNVSPDWSLTVHNVAGPEYGLKIGLYWWIPGILLTLAYFAYVYRKFAGKARPEEGEGY